MHDGIFVTHAGPISHRARIWAAVLAVGEPVVAADETALWLATSTRREPRAVHVGVLDGRRVAEHDGIAVHHYPDLGESRVLWNASPPRIRIDQAVLDIAHRTRTLDGLVAALAGPVGDGLTTVPRLRASLAIRPRMRNRALVHDILADVSDGARSPLERRDLRNDRAHGIDLGSRQVIFRAGRARVVVDVVYSGDGLRVDVVKELDGRLGHAGHTGRLRDMRRDNASEVRNQRHLRYGWEDEVGRPCIVAAETAHVLTLNGWRGRLTPCGPACAGASYVP